MGTKSMLTRKERFYLRRKALKAMLTLTNTIEKIEGSSEKPERDYARIFKNESIYVKMQVVLSRAYQASFKSKLKLFGPDYMRLNDIIMACRMVKLPEPTEQQLSKAAYRTGMVEKLKHRVGPDGVNGYDTMVHLAQIRARAGLQFEITKKVIEKMNAGQEP
jgi:hypothetical protein